MNLGNRDAVELAAWRRKLHAQPEISGEEAQTAREVEAFLAPTKPDRVLSGLGGHGLAFVYEGAGPGPTAMFRAELDALPIEETGEAQHRSQVPGKGHLCGHDGHMAILAGVARALGRKRPASGRVVLLFQPAEETGAGAAAVLADRRFAEVKPDFAFALHNLPGLPLGEAALKEGPANCASAGMRIVLSGRTAHASMPETGVSPMPALSRLMPALTALGSGSGLREDFAMATVTHAAMGEPAFGVAPGRAEVWATLRTLRDSRMDALREAAEVLAKEAAREAGLACAVTYHDVFRHCDNDPEATERLRRAIEAEGVPCLSCEPMRGSEDFGWFADVAKSSMFFLGAGLDGPNLHNPDYDFPDDLIPIGARVFLRAARDLLG